MTKFKFCCRTLEKEINDGTIFPPRWKEHKWEVQGIDFSFCIRFCPFCGMELKTLEKKNDSN